MQQVEENISGIEDTIEQISVKDNLKSKKLAPPQKNSGNLQHYEKTT